MLKRSKRYHGDRRIKFKTRIQSLTAPEIVRPRPIEEAVEQLRKTGLVEDNKDETPRISWAEAKKLTRMMVERALKRKQPEVQEYADDIGITKSMAKATWQYAQLSVATELIMLSSKGVKVRSLSEKHIDANCGRGLPWAVKQQSIGCKTKQR